MNIADSRFLYSKYDAVTRDELIADIDDAILSLPEDQRASVTFGIDEVSYQYEEGSSYKFSMFYQRPETEAEQAKREAQEAEQKKNTEAWELRQYEALKAKFEGKKSG